MQLEYCLPSRAPVREIQARSRSSQTSNIFRLEFATCLTPPQLDYTSFWVLAPIKKHKKSLKKLLWLPTILFIYLFLLIIELKNEEMSKYVVSAS